MRAAKQMLAERDVSGTCSVLFLCAARQAWLGDYPGALESIAQVLKLAKRRHLPQDAVWGYWGAGAIYAQQGEFQRSADTLRYLQAMLKTGDWVLADLVEMIAQALERMSGGGRRPALSADIPLLTNPYLQPVLRALFQWGQVQGSTDGENIFTVEWAPITLGPTNCWRLGWQRLLQWVRGNLQPGRNGMGTWVRQAPAAEPALPLFLPMPVSGGNPGHHGSNGTADTVTLPKSEGTEEDAREIPEPAGTSIALSSNIVTEPTVEIPQAATLSAVQEHAPHSPALAAPHPPALAMYFFGSFRLYQDDQLVADWPSQKSLAIFKYLAANRGKPVAKDILMDYFWADAETEVARRNLHQAIYALRQVLKRGWPNIASILFENDCYLLNPAFELWLDFEAFDNHIQAGRRLEETGSISQAMTEYSIAQELYPGDFLEDDLYEDWPNAQRTYYRGMYMDLLDRLCAYFIQQRQYYPAIILCQKILAKDNCAEQAYRNLILCYLAQGQRQLAIREYQTCVHVMKQELNLAPSEETRTLYTLIMNAQPGNEQRIG